MEAVALGGRLARRDDRRVSAVRRDDRARAESWFFRQLVTRTLREVEAALAVMATPYVSISGGKDSTVLLDLVRRVDPAVPAIWSDDELEHDETVAFVRAVPNHLTVVGHATHAEWFTSWTDLPAFRPPEPDAIPIPGLMDVWSIDAGYDGAFIGLRAEENRHRRIRSARFGPLHRHASGQWRATPIQHWTVDDVWAYIAARDLPYNPVYDTLAQIGVPRPEQRVGPLPLAQGWHLKRGWPELFARLEARYGRMWGFA